jgi:hypothetical protein
LLRERGQLIDDSGIRDQVSGLALLLECSEEEELVLFNRAAKRSSKEPVVEQLLAAAYVRNSRGLVETILGLEVVGAIQSLDLSQSEGGAVK